MTRHWLPPTATEAEAAVQELLATSEHYGTTAIIPLAADLGISMRPIHDRNYIVAALPIEFAGQYFEFQHYRHPSARLAVVIVAFDSDEETPVDLVAFDAAAPDRVALLLGQGELLGAYDAFNPASYLDGRPLPIWRTPLGWLRAGCRGAVLLQPQSAWRILPSMPGRPHAPGRFLAEDLQHAQELARLTDGHMDPHRIVLHRPEKRHG